jgi:hypothetical protein
MYVVAECCFLLSFVKLYSPHGGIAENVQTQIESLVSSVTPDVTTISIPDPIKVAFTVSEQDAEVEQIMDGRT